jgi:predicted nucleic-acid-binding Zn-ribbon protein
MYLPTRTVTPEMQSKIQEALQALAQRGAKIDYCPRCSARNWLVDLLAIPAIALPNPMIGAGMAYSPPTGFIPLITIMCQNCGHTLLHNLNVLGISY